MRIGLAVWPSVVLGKAVDTSKFSLFLNSLRLCNFRNVADLDYGEKAKNFPPPKNSPPSIFFSLLKTSEPNSCKRTVVVQRFVRHTIRLEPNLITRVLSSTPKFACHFKHQKWDFLLFFSHYTENSRPADLATILF